MGGKGPGRTGPERTCVACRQKGSPDTFVRLVRHPVDGSVVVDLPGKLPGRGAWVHPTQACVTDLQSKGGKLARALDGKVDASDLQQRLRDALHRAALDGISMAAASGSLVGGHDRLVLEIGQGTVRDLVVANDASPRTLASLERAAELVYEDSVESDGPAIQVRFVVLPISRDELGTRTGRGSRAALGVRATRGSAFLRRQLRRLRDLG